MALSDDELAEALADEESPNEAMRLPGQGMSGPRDAPDRELLRRKRFLRDAMSTYLAAGLPGSQIITAFETAPHLKTFGLDEQDIRSLMREVWASWEEEDSDREPHRKAAATRRLLRAIGKADNAGAFQAVAMLEKQLAEIEGTNAPKHVRVETESKISVAVLAVLGEMDPVKVRQLIAEEAERALTAGTTLPAEVLMPIAQTTERV